MTRITNDEDWDDPEEEDLDEPDTDDDGWDDGEEDEEDEDD